jgi:gamma-glutamyltranspeptidase/glutathione hydrolase
MKALRLLLVAVFAFAGEPSAAAGAAIASAQPLATAAGAEILDRGGNAFDAAIAVAATLGVVEPYNSGLGGGGFFLLHRVADGHETVIDARETAPAAAHRDMYLDAKGEVIARASLDGALAAAIPGLPAALVYLASHYGRLPLRLSLAPAIRAARHGFPVSPIYRERAQGRLAALRADPAAARTFLVDDEAPPLGHCLIQDDLATALADLAVGTFFDERRITAWAQAVQAAGGIWQPRDLLTYRVIERSPLYGGYHGMRVTSVPPPSSGGVVLIQALNLLAAYDLDGLDVVTRAHLIVEALRRAYRDRAIYLGDPGHVKVPMRKLTGADHARQQGRSIAIDRATPSAELGDTGPATEAAGHTTHFSIVDAEGNRVAATLSLNAPFGSAYMASGTGILLNNEMDDFSLKPGAPNLYGLVGAEANAIAAGKRPLSSMTPAFLEMDGRVAVLGTPGGSRIISMVLLAALDFAARRPPASWVTLPRFHHQYLPDVIQFEPGAFTGHDQTGLRRLGHALQPLANDYGNMQAIQIDARGPTAAADPRGEGLAAVVGNDPGIPGVVNPCLAVAN